MAYTIDSIEYTNRKKITVSHTNIDSDLTSFPLLVQIVADTDIGPNTNSDGYDIRFTDSEGTLLNFERVKHTVSGSPSQLDATYWVECDLSGSVDTDIYIYYRSDDTADGSDAETLWSNAGAVGVWHLNESSGNAIDAASTRDMTLYNTPTQAQTGQINKAYDFEDTTSEYCEVDSTPRTAIPISFSFWLKPADTTLAAYQYPFMICDKDKYTIYWGMILNYADAGSVSLNARSSFGNIFTTASANLTQSQWGFVAGVIESATSRKCYVNGGNVGTTDTSLAAPSGLDRTSIGRAGDSTPGYYFDGLIEEVRIYNKALSAAEIKFSYYNQYSTAQLTFGDEESDNLPYTQVLTGYQYAHGTVIVGDYLFISFLSLEVQKVLRINLNDTTDISDATLGGYGTRCSQIRYSPTKDKLYVIGGDAAFVLLEVDPDTLSVTEVINMSTYGAMDHDCIAINEADQILYTVNTSNIYAWDMTDWNSGDGTLLGAIFSSSDIKSLSHAMEYDSASECIFITTIDQPGYVTSIDVSNPASMAVLDCIQLTADYGMITDDLAVLGTTLWGGIETGANNGAIIQVDISDPSNLSVTYHNLYNSVRCWGVFYNSDTGYIWAVYSDGKIVVFNPNNTSQYWIYDTGVTNTNEIQFSSNGTVFLTTYTTPDFTLVVTNEESLGVQYIEGSAISSVTTSANLNVAKTISGQSNISVTTTGSVIRIVSISSQSNVNISIAGSIDVSRNITTQCNVTISTSGTLSSNKKLISQVNVSTSVTGALSVTKGIASQINVGVSTESALSVVYTLVSQSNIAVSVSGVLSLVKGINSQSDVTVSVTGTLSSIRSISSQSNIAISTTGALYLIKGISSQSNVNVSITGTITKSLIIASQSNITVSTTGALSLVRNISSQSNITVLTSGVITKLVTIVSQSNITVSTTGTLTLVKGLTSQCNITTVAENSLSVERKLTSSININTSISGFIEIEGQVTLISESNIIILTSGSLSVAKYITSQCNVEIQVQGVLESEKYITSSANINTSITGVLSAVKNISGQSNIDISVTGLIEVEGQLTLIGQTNINVITQGILLVQRNLVSASEVIIITAGDLTVGNQITLQGASIVNVVISGGINVLKSIVGITLINITTESELIKIRTLLGSVGVNITTDGLIEVQRKLLGQSDIICQIIGNVIVNLSLNGASLVNISTEAYLGTGVKPGWLVGSNLVMINSITGRI